MPVTTTPSEGFTVGTDTTLTIAGHVSDGNPLYVLLSWWVSTGGTSGADVIDSVTFDGDPLTFGGLSAVAGNTMEWWRLPAHAAATGDVVITLNTAKRITAGVLNLSGWPTAIGDHTFIADGDDVTPPTVEVDSLDGAEVISWLGFNHEDQDVTIPSGSTALWNQEGESVTPGGPTGDQRSAAVLIAGAAPSVSVTWTGSESAEFFGVAALSFDEPVGRHLLTGTDHTVSGLANLIAGDAGTVEGKYSEAHGQNGTLVGERSVLFNQDGTVRTVTGDGLFAVYADDIEFNGVPFSAGTNTRSIGLSIDGGGAVITTGIKADLYIPFSCTITAVTMLADQSGAIVVDIWNDTYANYPPDDSDSITASAPPTISGPTNKSTDSTLTGWDTSIAAGSTLRFNVDSVSAIERLSLVLTVTV